jgi:hypothetical protein
MKGQKGWDYRPYTRLNEIYKRDYPYICRLAPCASGCEIEWFDNGSPQGAHSAEYRQLGVENTAQAVKVSGPVISLSGLKAEREYEVRVYRTDKPDTGSAWRRFRTGNYPGKVINYLHPKDNAYAFSGNYLADPFILRTPTGRLLVPMSVFTGGFSQNFVILCKSDDNGETWQYLCEIMPSFWGKMFCNKGKIYMLSITNEYGCAQIGCSEDDGAHWSPPVIIFPGAGMTPREPGMHTSPGRIAQYKGRIWTGVEYGNWALGYHESGALSISEDDDPMKGSNWTLTEFLRFNPLWEGAVNDTRRLNYIEGNVIAGPDGTLYNILRNNNNNERALENHGKAVVLKLDPANPEKKQEFVKIIDFNGGHTKFVIDRDEKTGVYYSIVNRLADPTNNGMQRNIASLAVSKDLFNWKIVKDLLNSEEEAPEEVGYQYILHIQDGEDLLYVSRTAVNHANNFHDSNCITFHREKNFRQLLKI